MGKDREGKFHPGKGKPSGANKEEGLGLRKTFNPDDLERDEQISARYTPIDEDELSPDVHVRHPNRNTSKGEDFARSEENQYKSRQQEQTEEFAKTEAEELVSIIPKDLFTYLANFTASNCISIYLPTNRSGQAVNEQQDVLNFKNALQQVEKTLNEKNTDPVAIKKMLEPGYDLLRDEKFWKSLSPGLAVYVAEDFFKFIRLPGSVTEEVLVNSSFSVSKLLPFMVRKEFFYLLVISKKNPKFYRADAFGIEHIPVDELPVAVDDVVRFENKEDQKLWRTGQRGGTGGANFHGIGAGKPDEKQHIALYLEEVDDTLWDTHLNKSTAPLLLAGLDHLIPIYRSVSDYSHLWPEALTGNHQDDDPDSLYKQAMEVMKPYFEQGLRKALIDYGNKSATALTSANPEEIIPAAFYGRVSHLFIQKDASLWGTFNEESNELNLSKDKNIDLENLADKTVARTIQTGGEVYLLDTADMPQPGLMAAIFRY
jgi:hypothetical protein